MTHTTPPSKPNIWRAPLMSGGVIAAGLTAALFIDGVVGQVICCVALAAPILVVLVSVVRSR